MVLGSSEADGLPIEVFNVERKSVRAIVLEVHYAFLAFDEWAVEGYVKVLRCA